MCFCFRNRRIQGSQSGAFMTLWMENFTCRDCKRNLKCLKEMLQYCLSSLQCCSLRFFFFCDSLLWAKNKMPSFTKQLKSLREELKHDKRLNFKFNKQTWNTAKRTCGYESNCFQVGSQGAFQQQTQVMMRGKQEKTIREECARTVYA